MNKLYKKIVFFIIILLSSFVHLGAQKKIVDTFEAWPLGTSTSPFANRLNTETFAEIKAAGISYIEVNMNPMRGKPVEEQKAWVRKIKSESAAAGLKIWSVHLPYGRDWEITEMDEKKRTECVKQFIHFVELAKEFNPEKFVLHASFEPIPDEERAQRILNSQQSINTINKEIRKKTKAQLLIEDLPRTCIGNTIAEMELLLSRVDESVGICFDTNHLLKDKPQDFVRKFGSRITSVHISDYDGIDEKHWLMGKGIIDWPEVIAQLVKSGYSGVFMFEIAGKNMNTASDLRQNWEQIRDEVREIYK